MRTFKRTAREQQELLYVKEQLLRYSTGEAITTRETQSLVFMEEGTARLKTSSVVGPLGLAKQYIHSPDSQILPPVSPKAALTILKV